MHVQLVAEAGAPMQECIGKAQTPFLLHKESKDSYWKNVIAGCTAESDVFVRFVSVN